MAVSRFEITYRENTTLGKMQIKILVDKETGVNYIFAADDNGCALTPLLDAQGKPVVSI